VRTWRCRRRTARRTEATGLDQGSTGVLAARSMAGHELTPSPLAPREGSLPEGPRRRRRLGHAAVFGRVIEPDPTEGRGTPQTSISRRRSITLVCDVLMLMASNNVSGEFRLWRHDRRKFILFSRIATVSDTCARGTEDVT
jgi:hypothetical protein